MIERDPMLALRGLIDEPIAPRAAFAEELRARLLTELGSHRPPAISEERTMEITTPGLQLVVPSAKPRQLPSWRRIAEIAAIALLLFGLFVFQFVLSAAVPASWRGRELQALSVVYLVLAALTVIRHYRQVLPLFRDGLFTPYRVLGTAPRSTTTAGKLRLRETLIGVHLDRDGD